jgi:DNA helicase MCM8
MWERQILQKLYLTMRAEASTGQSIPVTTRHLESLVRLAQARAKLELREHVTAEDAHDVVQMLQESLLDTFTTETGEMDFGRKGGMSLAKQVKTFVAALNKEAELRGTALFQLKELQEVRGLRFLVGCVARLWSITIVVRC